MEAEANTRSEANATKMYGAEIIDCIMTSCGASNDWTMTPQKAMNYGRFAMLLRAIQRTTVSALGQKTVRPPQRTAVPTPNVGSKESV